MKKAVLVKGDLPESMVQELSQCEELGVDCEMMGLNPFRDRLCLVQIGAENGPSALLQVDEKSGAPGLKSLLEDEKVRKIFHYARMDCLFLKVRLNIEACNIYCTKLSSRLVRTYTDKHGLKELVRDLVGDQLDKTSQSSDWGREKLLPEQLKYAEIDIKYLFKLRRTLEEMLRREGRNELAVHAQKFLPYRVEMDRLGYGDVFEH